MFNPKLGTIFEMERVVYVVALVVEGKNKSPTYYCLRYNPQSDGTNFDSAYMFNCEEINDARIIGNAEYIGERLKEFTKVMDRYYELDYNLGCLIRSELNEKKEE